MENLERSYIDFDEIISEGLHTGEHNFPHLGQSSYSQPVRILTFENVVCTPHGVFLPCKGRWILETTLAGNLTHRPPADRVGLLKAAGENLDWAPDMSGLPENKETLFWGSYPWDSNYQHFFIETLPRIFLGRNYLPEQAPLRYVVSEPSFIPDCLRQIGLWGNQLLTKSAFKGARRVARVHVAAPIYVNMLRLKSQLLTDCVRLMTELHYGPLSGPENIYVGRRVHDENHGAGRILLNETMVSGTLAERSFETLYMEELSMSEKIATLASARQAVMPIGAGLVNLCFSPKLERLLILQHPHLNLPGQWFENLLKMFNNVSVQALVVNVDETKHAQNLKHAPFTVDTDRMVTALDNWGL